MFFKTQKKHKLYYSINTSSIFDKAYFLLFFFYWKTSFYISFHSKGKSLEFKIEFDFVVGLYF
jgi:hypothetical protein